MLVSIAGCNTSTYNLEGNWSMISSNQYYEIQIGDSTIRTYRSGFDYWPIDKKYETRSDSFFLNKNTKDKYANTYIIIPMNDSVVTLRARNEDIILIKRKNTDFTFDKIVDSITDMQFQRVFNARLIKTLDSMDIKVPRLNRMLYEQ